jgi:hypothetical protein
MGKVVCKDVEKLKTVNYFKFLFISLLEAITSLSNQAKNIAIKIAKKSIKYPCPFEKSPKGKEIVIGLIFGIRLSVLMFR